MITSDPVNSVDTPDASDSMSDEKSEDDRSDREDDGSDADASTRADIAHGPHPRNHVTGRTPWVSPTLSLSLCLLHEYRLYDCPY